MFLLSGRTRVLIVIVLLVCGVGTAFVLTSNMSKKGRPALPKIGVKPTVILLPPAAATLPVDAPLPEGRFNPLETGLDFGTFLAPARASDGDGKICILRIDPRKFKFCLLASSGTANKMPKTTRQWCQACNCVAAINASMYRDNGLSVAYMRDGAFVHSSKVTSDKCALVFNPTDANRPLVQVADLEKQRLADLKSGYATLIQSIRMVSWDGRNVWKQSPKRCSTAAIGQDGQGRIMFIHVRTPYTTHDLADILLKLPIDLKRAMYVEGGPEAQLYINAGRREFELLGDYVASLPMAASNCSAWPVPNVIGIARR